MQGGGRQANQMKVFSWQREEEVEEQKRRQKMPCDRGEPEWLMWGRFNLMVGLERSPAKDVVRPEGALRPLMRSRASVKPENSFCFLASSG